ncbi:CotH kinase family protein [Larkinella soli]|uniref:CotH kinase family protein n=1 Tax=Larkinella soli TaxID=1770527 RepID=UPI000FFB8F47|nr:CotH kinase family protein [Larkinella soli]
MNSVLCFRNSAPGLLIGLLLFFLSVTVRAQSVTADAGTFQVDKTLKLIVCNKVPAFPSGAGPVTIQFDEVYTFTESISAFEVGREYKLSLNGTNYLLYFTGFPIVHITTGGAAISETDDRTGGSVSLSDPAGSLFTSSMGVRVRGNTSRLYPKKSYNMQLWTDPSGATELETSLLGMRSDSKWLFLALYNEPLRVNNMASWAIWRKMHKLYYLAQEPDAQSGIRMRYCDVFINNSYNGVYAITEDLDRKQLKLKKTRDDGGIRGELYKADSRTDATAFLSVFNGNELPPFDNSSPTWAGYEIDYPKDPFWNSLSGLIQLFVKSTDDDFKAQIADRLYLDGVIDNFLFLNAIGATEDNMGNNQFIGRYKENEPYMLMPWDFDVTFGNVNGKMDNIAEYIRTNGLYYRLMTQNPVGFKSRMKKRWFALRQGELQNAAFKKNLTDNITVLNNDGAYKREQLRWPGTLRLDEQSAIISWIDSRMAFLDQYFGEFPDQDPQGVQITLQEFKGEISGGDKLLSWTTSSEKNAKRFEVEFSTDGLNFSKAGEVAATGNSTSPRSYSFAHTDASAIAYYRLKMINIYDLFKYSSEVLIGGCPTPPAAPTVSASLLTINAGQSTVLSATGCAGTVLWSTNQTGSPLTVSPATTTTYTARCRQAVGCESIPSNAVTVKVNPVTAYEGYLNTASCSVISGWAWDSKRPKAFVVVEILDGQNVAAMAIADIYRQDLKTAGKGNGIHGYSLALPDKFKDNKPHNISVRVQGSSYILKNSPKSITCAGSTPPPSNQPPVAPTVSVPTGTVNQPYSTTLAAFTDPDNNPLTYSLTGTLPSGVGFNATTRVLSGTPTATGTFSLTYTANDGQASTNTTVSLTVNPEVPPANQPPTAPTIPELTATVNTAYSTTLPAFTDPNGDALTYTLSTPPAGLTFNATSRVLSGTPTVTGPFSLTYTANDGQASTNTTVSLTVNPEVPPANQPPSAPTIAPLTATVNTPFSTTLAAFTDPNGDALTYALSTPPAGLTFNATTRVLSGTPTVTGPFSLTYTANDGQASTNTTVSLTVGSGTVVTGNFEGYLDKAECTSIRGWVWDSKQPNTALTVEILSDGVSVGTISANIFRQDLKTAGKGNGIHGYIFTTPAALKDNLTHQISVKVLNSNYTLKGSPKALKCAPAARLSADAEEAGSQLRAFLLGNPALRDEVIVEVQGAQGRAVQFQLMTAGGKLLSGRTVEVAEPSHRQSVSLGGQAAGLYLLRVEAGSQAVTLKVLRP